MAKLLRLPEVAESVVEGEIVRWIKKEGEAVQKNEPIVEIMTEKVTVEVPSPFEGTLVKILAKEGDVIPVHDPIAVLADPGEDPASIDLQALLGEASPVAASEAPVEKSEAPAVSEEPLPQESGRVLATPAARKAARELGVDLTRVPPSTPVGRIVKADVLRYAEQQKTAPEIQAAPAPTVPAVEAIPGGAIPEPERRPFRGLRREIARRLRESKDRAVHTLHVDEADLTELVALRQRMKPFAEEAGVKLTYLPFLIKAVIATLRRHPEFNATVDDEAGEMLLHRTYNIGIAVATDQGLVVPVIHHAERYSLLNLARKVADLAERARAGQLTLEDVEGGTFSITNIGSIGGLFSFPVINYPQVAILGFHSIKPRPVVVDGAVQIRQMTYFSLAFDHRVVDGAQAALFTRDLIRYLETPDRLFLESL